MNERVAIFSLVFCLPLVWTALIDLNKQCGFEDDFQCGHSCIKDGDTCACGDTSWKGGKNTTVDGCCPYSPNSCIKDDKEGHVTCTQGKVKKLGEPCPSIGQCLTNESSKAKVICDDGSCGFYDTAYASQVCRGRPVCSSSADDKNEKNYCSNLHQCGNLYRACPQVPGGTKNHTECYLTPNPGQFNCLNRMEKYPEIFLQRIYQEEDFNLNKHLNYTESGIYCQENRFIPWNKTGLDALADVGSCVSNSKSNTKRYIGGDPLWKLLIRDFGFSGRHFIPEQYFLENYVRETLSWYGKFGCPVPAKIGSQTIQVNIAQTEFCDGVVHCPNATDENFDLCKKVWTQTKAFGPSTYTCQSKYVGNNYTVHILAKTCNGEIECHDNVDENDCQDTKRNLAIVLASCLLVFLLSSTLFLYHSKIQKIVGEEVWFMDNSSDEELEVLVVNSQEVCQREQACRVLFERKLTKHNGQMGRAINDLKDRLNPSAIHFLMDTVLPKTFIGRTFDRIKQVKQSLLTRIEKREAIAIATKKLNRLNSDYDKTENPIPLMDKFKFIIMTTLKLMMHVFDMSRDIILIITIHHLLEGAAFIFQWVFVSLVCWFIIPYSLGCLNIALGEKLYIFDDYGPDLTIFFTILCTPFLPFLLILCEYFAELELRFCPKNQIELWTQRYKKSKEATSSFIRTELGCETTIQLFLGVLLLVFTKSPTRTSETLSTFDEDGGYFSQTLGIPPVVFITFNNIWSLFSGWRSYVRGMKASKERFPLLSQGILGFFVVLSMVTKATASILFLTPSLGLFSCLRHYQGLFYPYEVLTNPARYGEVDVTTDSGSYSNMTFQWSQLTLHNYTNQVNITRPETTVLTYFDEKQILSGFWIILAFQVMLIIVTKKMTNPRVFQCMHWMKILSHGIENIWVPAPMQDWDHIHCVTLDDYKRKRKDIQVEMGITIGLNFLVNFFMLIPMWILAYNVNIRHNLLLTTIEPLPEEIEAYWLVNFLAIDMILVLFFAAFLQFLCYMVYNKIHHPFQNLLTEATVDLSKTRSLTG